MLKKIYTLFLVLAVTALAIAGSPKDTKMKAKPAFKSGYETAEEMQQMKLNNQKPQYFRTEATRGPGDSIGYGGYDYGTNGGPLDNLINYGDGTLAFGRMSSKTVGAAAWADRATYYRYFNGTTWSAFNRVEPVRVGWGSVQQFSAGGGANVIVSHVRPRVYVDASKGAASWSEASPPATGVKGSQWPRQAVDAGLIVHVIGSPSTPDAKTPYYIRSLDAGATWDTTKQTVFATMGKKGDADAYDVAVSGTKVAIIQAGSGADIILAKSTNDGAAWTESKIYEAKDDSGSLNLNENNPQSDGTVDLKYDASGVLHAAWGTYMAIGDSMKRPQLFYSLKTGIYYWREGQSPKLVVLPTQDSGLVKKPLVLMPDVDGGFTTIPNIGFGTAGKIYIVYQGQTSEITTPDSLPYCHLYAIYSEDNGATWRGPTDLTPGTGFDASFPSLAYKVDTHLHIVYNTDAYPGSNLQGSQADTLSVIKYLKFPVANLVSTVITSVGDKDITGSPEAYTLSQNYPNPFNPTTSISFSLPRAGQTTLKVYNMLGQEIATLVDGFRNAGVYTANFDASRLASGVYFYKLQSGSYLETKKMVFAK